MNHKTTKEEVWSEEGLTGTVSEKEVEGEIDRLRVSGGFREEFVV